MSNKSSKSREFKHFSKIAKEWWIPDGKFKILHEITPLRIKYILKMINQKQIKDLEILDLGCGGGLTCEPLARLKAKVTGVDFVKQNIEVAKNHAKISKLQINYIHEDLDSLKIKKKYDIVLLLEILEHLDNWKNIILKIKKILKPNGLLVISSINKTSLSKIFAIFVAENILKWVPKNTHDYDKFVTPNELSNILSKNNFNILDTTGMNFNPFSRQWKLNKNIYPINYFCAAKLS
ncbi:bifunctional 2-polyprenyl-6-hydroxyphenol methylase/3-demethylubiquinol 3-O-methyltransferase UbiG [Alphaproteobacteria bacterium]|nr:bifunctional 2-polyprenyl-6-hydroxyphenol methylase/3-demethylubiquinol 3-O-methyltransferase UbiG [Alphaproteobacteria bacterium]